MSRAETKPEIKPESQNQWEAIRGGWFFEVEEMHTTAAFAGDKGVSVWMDRAGCERHIGGERGNAFDGVEVPDFEGM